jgi:large subunit ribosomal protein L25
MAELTVDAQIRQEFGKNANRRTRAAGRVPAIVYGRGLESVAVSVDPKDLERILHSGAGHNTIFTLTFEGNAKNVLIRDYQLDPVNEKFLHADFHTVIMDQLMTFQVPVEAVGTAEGVRLYGGVLDTVLREIELECLPTDLPDHIRVDVEHLEIGDSLRVGDLEVDESKIQVLSDPGQVVFNLIPPVAEEVEEVEEEEVEEEGEGEPEVISKGKAEEETDEE